MNFISYDPAVRQYHVNRLARDFLTQQQAPVVVASVAGIYRSGKSTLLNMLLASLDGDTTIQQDVFSTSSATSPETRGLWLAPKLVGSRGNVLVLDSEGLGSTSASSQHDVVIFSLTLLLSSLLAFNSKNAIDTANIDALHVATKFASMVTTASGVASFTPPTLVWALRDFTLQLDDNVSSSQYLEQALQQAAGQDNSTAATILHFFKSKQCVTFPAPTSSQDFQHLESDLGLKVQELASIIEAASPAVIAGSAVNGPMLLAIADAFLATINTTGALPQLVDVWSGAVAASKHSLLGATVEGYQVRLDNVDTPLHFASTSCTLLTDTVAGLLHPPMSVPLDFKDAVYLVQKLAAVRDRALARTHDRMHLAVKSSMDDVDFAKILTEGEFTDIDNLPLEELYIDVLKTALRAVMVTVNNTSADAVKVQREVARLQHALATSEEAGTLLTAKFGCLSDEAGRLQTELETRGGELAAATSRAVLTCTEMTEKALTAQEEIDGLELTVKDLQQRCGVATTENLQSAHDLREAHTLVERMASDLQYLEKRFQTKFTDAKKKVEEATLRTVHSTKALHQERDTLQETTAELATLRESHCQQKLLLESLHHEQREKQLLASADIRKREQALQELKTDLAVISSKLEGEQNRSRKRQRREGAESSHLSQTVIHVEWLTKQHESDATALQQLRDENASLRRELTVQKLQ